MMTVTESGNQDFELHPAGAFAARCFKLIDLGTQAGEWQGKATASRKLLLSFETDELMADGRPFTISRRFTLSLAETAALRKFLESWRGRAFTPDELKNGFDLRKLLGAPCLINLTHSERAGKTYANIASISPLPKGVSAQAAVNKPVIFDLDDVDMAVFDSLSQGLQKTIMASPEWKKFESSPPVKNQYQPTDEEPFNDEISF